MSTYRLFAWGANSHGQLGIGKTSQEEVFIPQEVNLAHLNLDPGCIKKVTGGAGHSFLIDTSGAVYSCGWNDKGQAGTEENILSLFQRVDNLKELKVVDVVCGWDSSMILTDNGKVYSWGSNSHGQLGVTTVPVGSKTVKPQEVEISHNQIIQKISFGLRHSAIVTHDGYVFVSGDSSKGQLGIEYLYKKRVEKFTEVPHLKSVVGVACGQHHTIAMTQNADIFAWGSNKHGQLGLSQLNYKMSNIPIKIDRNKNYEFSPKEIKCGWTHNAILSNDDRVFLWGRNSYGQLGKTKKSAVDCRSIPEPVEITKNIKQLSAGSEHNVVVADDGTVWSWGWNEHGNCGNGNSEDVFTPTQVLLPQGFVKILGSGAGHSFAVVKTDC